MNRILNSTEALRVRKQAFYLEMEQTVFSALCELWPEPGRRPALRVTAMVAMGIMRLANEARRNDPSGRSLADHLRDGFAMLDVRP